MLSVKIILECKHYGVIAEMPGFVIFIMIIKKGQFKI